MSTAATTNRAPLTGAPVCPICGGRMWDNRTSKRSPRAPDFKCRNPECKGRIWPGQHHAAAPILARRTQAPEEAGAPADATVMTESAGEGSDTRDHTPPAVTLRQCYLDVTDYVLAEVRARYEAANVPCDGTTVAAIVATLFIASCRKQSV